ncbi:MAG: cardiolipin synthase [Planctomycetaceae bacterium]
MDSLWTWLFVEGYLVTLLLLPIVLLQPRRNSSATLAWMMAIVMLPYLGAVLFLVFGVNRVERRVALRQASRARLGQLVPPPSLRVVLPSEVESPLEARLLRLTQRLTGYAATSGNSVEIIDDTNRTLGLIEQALGNARHTIHLEYYIWQPDRTGNRLRELLVARARAGVRVRCLYDGLGSLWLGRQFLRSLREAGVEVAAALPGSSLRDRWSINLRNHRKIIVVDDRIAFTGGMNIGDEYHGRNPRLGYWRDTHLRIEGPAVSQLRQIFSEDWFFATGAVLPDQAPHRADEPLGDVIAQTIPGGPDGVADVFHAVFFAAINDAREQITLATSYFIPTAPLETALETAALRGVRVRLLLPGLLDHQWMVTAQRAWYRNLLKAGVEIWEYQRGMLHAKTLTIDGAWSCVGSTNFDSRSLLLNFEAGLALLGPRPARDLLAQFELDLRHARRVDLAEFERRGWLAQLAEQSLRLLAPIL